MYLEPIFTSEDIMRQMPNEGKMYLTVDKNFKDVMRFLMKAPGVLKCTGVPGMLEKLVDSNNLLEQINKGLNTYLEKKRLYFPRFFFLSNDELLEILAETKDPTRVQPHLKKCFEGIAKIEFDGRLDIHAMFSSEGERVDLIDYISTSAAKGAVEEWLLELQQMMVASVRDVAEKAKNAYPNFEREEWVKNWPGQVVLNVSQVFWTSEVHEAIRGGPTEVAAYKATCDQQIASIVKLVRGKLTTQQRITLGALITIDVHARDIVEELVVNKGGCRG